MKNAKKKIMNRKKRRKIKIKQRTSIMETELWKEKNKRTEKNNVTVSKNVNHVRMLTFSLKLSPALPL